MQHDAWLMARLRGVGFDKVQRFENETPEQFGARLGAELFGSDDVLLVLGGFLVPAEIKDTQWTPAIAKETASFVGGLSDPDDKLAYQQVVLSVLIPFLESGLSSSTSSEPSSVAAAVERNGALEPAIPSVNGAASYEPWRGTTLPGPGGSFAGP